MLQAKLNDIDRLKQMEDLVQSQRWGELGQLAESMKTLSRTMAVTSGSLWNTTASSTRVLEETLNN